MRNKIMSIIAGLAIVVGGFTIAELASSPASATRGPGGPVCHGHGPGRWCDSTTTTTTTTDETSTTTTTTDESTTTTTTTDETTGSTTTTTSGAQTSSTTTTTDAPGDDTPDAGTNVDEPITGNPNFTG